MIYLQISEKILSDFGGPPVDEALFERAAEMTLEHEGASQAVEATLVLTDDDQLHELNHQFLGIDAPTDVLSFPSGEVDPDTGSAYLGDVVISYPRAVAQAAAGGHPVEDELQLLAVHGMLHLLGYDHAEEGEKAAMWAAQADVLRSLGASISGPAQ